MTGSTAPVQQLSVGVPVSPDSHFFRTATKPSAPSLKEYVEEEIDRKEQRDDFGRAVAGGAVGALGTIAAARYGKQGYHAVRKAIDPKFKPPVDAPAPTAGSGGGGGRRRRRRRNNRNRGQQNQQNQQPAQSQPKPQTQPVPRDVDGASLPDGAPINPIAAAASKKG